MYVVRDLRYSPRAHVVLLESLRTLGPVRHIAVQSWLMMYDSSCFSGWSVNNRDKGVRRHSSQRVLNDKGGEASTPQHGAQTLLLHKNIFGGDLLSHTPTGCSTISAKSLNYRVRNETGCTPLAITTEKPSTTTTPTVQPGNLKQHTPN